ncbi:hypothetical protein [Nocardia gipuzkoensis]
MNWLQVIPVAAAVSAATTIAIRWFDRPRAVLRLESRLMPGPSMKTSAGMNQGDVTLINDGDGHAYDIRVFGSKCDVGVQTQELFPDQRRHWTYRIPIAKSGEVIRLLVAAEGPPLRGDEAVIVSWSPSPRRWFRRTQRFRLADIGAEELFPPGVAPIASIPRYVRRTRSLEKRSPRAVRYGSLGLPDQDEPAQLEETR